MNSQELKENFINELKSKGLPVMSVNAPLVNLQKYGNGQCLVLEMCSVRFDSIKQAVDEIFAECKFAFVYEVETREQPSGVGGA